MIKRIQIQTVTNSNRCFSNH